MQRVLFLGISASLRVHGLPNGTFLWRWLCGPHARFPGVHGLSPFIIKRPCAARRTGGKGFIGKSLFCFCYYFTTLSRAGQIIDYMSQILDAKQKTQARQQAATATQQNTFCCEQNFITPQQSSTGGRRVSAEYLPRWQRFPLLHVLFQHVPIDQIKLLLIILILPFFQRTASLLATVIQ